MELAREPASPYRGSSLGTTTLPRRASSGKSQTDLARFLGGAVYSLEDTVDEHLIRGRFIRAFLAQHGDEMRELGAVGLDEGALARGRSHGRDVDRASVQLLEHPERCEAGTPSRRQCLEPPTVVVP